MRLVEGKIKWASRVNPSLIIRLYESDARGFQDDDLVDEAGCAIVARAEDVLTATASHYYHKAKCPSCGEIISFTPENHNTNKKDDTPLECVCGYKTTLYEYQKSYQDKKLHGGGALPALEQFIQQYTAAKDYSAKMLAIDFLIHTFHYELQGNGRYTIKGADFVK
jgi:phage FluMu protein Com